MREILFRGKRVDNGEWDTGFLVKTRFDTSEEKTFITDKMTGYHTPVDLATVGQFTGLLDKNNKKIFEGDIVRIKYDTLEYSICKVVFEYGQFVGTCFDGCLDSINHSKYPVEIIGNIFDNSELLNAKTSNNR